MKKLLFVALTLASVLAVGLGLAGYALAQPQQRVPNKPGVPLARDLQAQMPAPKSIFEWAYPMAPPGGARLDPNEVFTAEGADPAMKLTRRQINDGFAPPDWFPKDHAPMPRIVSNGREPHVRACTLCHLTSGIGHAESAPVSGLPVKYFIRQIIAFRDGDRMNIRAPNMIELAHDMTDKEMRDAANYYAKIPRSQWKSVRVVETPRAPANSIAPSGKRMFHKGAETMPVTPDIIYEVAESEQVELRNPRVGFAAYVPPGSIAKGRAVAQGNKGAFRACASCHGNDLRGREDVPRIAGRSPSYLVRQLADMKYGQRKGKALGDMKDIAPKLSDADILNVAAYVASRNP
jgi:cytochrome c553